MKKDIFEAAKYGAIYVAVGILIGSGIVIGQHVASLALGAPAIKITVTR